MPFVVDASVTASWLLPDERHPLAMRAYARLLNDSAVVPSLWWFEIRNMFIVNERRGRLRPEQTSEAMSLLAELQIVLDNEPVEAALLHLARHYRLTTYDAAYLELAQRRLLPLATLDDALITAARSEQVGLIGE